MQDFPVQVVLAGGLAPKEEADGLVRCVNLRCKGKGLESVLAPRMLAELSGVSWPFPQIFRLAGETFACLPDTILQVEDAVLTPLLTDIENAGYPWSATEIGGYKVFTNNKVVVTGGDTLAVDTDHVIPAGIAVCSASAQLVIAAPWAYGEWNGSSVMWGKIGAADFTVDRSNVAAIRYAACGTVLNLLPFRKKTLSGLHFGFIAFGTEGVTTFLAAPHPAIFSQLLAYPVGIHSQLAAAGTIEEQFFVDSNCNLCHIKDGEVKVLGYQHYLKGVQGAIVLSYDELNKELWVSY